MRCSDVGGIHAGSRPPLYIADQRPPGRAALRPRADAAVLLEHQAEPVRDGVHPLRHGGFHLTWVGRMDGRGGWGAGCMM